MSQAWALIDLRPEGQQHVVPCRPDGSPLPPHQVDGYCPCRPKAVRNGPLGNPILVHRMPGHGNEPFDA